MKLLTAAIVKDFIGQPLDHAKVKKLVTDAKLNLIDIKACIACLVFILSNAAKNEAEPATLARELEQLGLPKGLFPCDL